MDRAPGSAALALGARAGITLRLSRGESGFLIAADLIKPFRGSDAPRWLVPLTVGWEL
ncbi:MAG TPA: hypothetical protein VFL95_10300 [Gemmatimonadales bacterium]|nr:hypothetical protein [Gemmatimonadales bacterium]